MAKRGIDTEKLSISKSGRVVLTENDLEMLESLIERDLAGGNPTTNQNCTNVSVCDNSTNNMCSNQVSCNNTTNTSVCNPNPGDAWIDP